MQDDKDQKRKPGGQTGGSPQGDRTTGQDSDRDRGQDTPRGSNDSFGQDIYNPGSANRPAPGMGNPSSSNNPTRSDTDFDTETP